MLIHIGIMILSQSKGFLIYLASRWFSGGQYMPLDGRFPHYVTHFPFAQYFHNEQVADYDLRAR